MMMRNTVYCAISDDADHAGLARPVDEMVARVAAYVPGYRLRAPLQFDEPRPEWNGHARVAVLLEVEGTGDSLPPYAGNLDIMTAAAVRVGELLGDAITGDS